MIALVRIIRSRIFPFIVLVLVSVGFVSLHATENAPISPFDEYVYLDYLAKVPTQGLVKPGEETGEFARNAISCRGVLNFGEYGERCDVGTHQDDAKYPYGGRTGADIYTPLYFASTWVVAQPLTWLGVDLLDAGRLVGGLWLALGTSLTFTLLRLLRVNRPAALGLSLGMIATPVVFWATTYLSTDAPTLAVAATIGCVTNLVATRRLHPVYFPIVAAVAVLFKVQNLAAVGVGAVALLTWTVVQFIKARRESPARHSLALMAKDGRAITAVLALVAGLAAQVSWMVFRSLVTLPDVQDAGVDTVRLPLSLTGLVDEAFRFMKSIGATDMVPGAFGAFVANVFMLMAIAAVIGILVDSKSRPAAHFSVALAILVVTLTMGPALSLAVRFSVGYYFPLPARYGLVLIPTFVAAIGLYLYRFDGVGKWVVLAVGSLGAAAAIVA